jgi:hypothetical protein
MSRANATTASVARIRLTEQERLDKQHTLEAQLATFPVVQEDITLDLLTLRDDLEARIKSQGVFSEHSQRTSGILLKVRATGCGLLSTPTRQSS